MEPHDGVERFIRLPGRERQLVFQDFERASELFPDTDMNRDAQRHGSGKGKGKMLPSDYLGLLMQD